MAASLLLAVIATVVPIVGTIVAVALKIGRIYGAAEATAANYAKEVAEVRATMGRAMRRLQIIEDLVERLLTGSGRHRLRGPDGGPRG